MAWLFSEIFLQRSNYTRKTSFSKDRVAPIWAVKPSPAQESFHLCERLPQGVGEEGNGWGSYDMLTLRNTAKPAVAFLLDGKSSFSS